MGDDTKSSDKKEELKKTIKDTRERADRIVEKTDDVRVTFGRVGDLGKIVVPLVDDVVGDADIDEHQNFWDGLNEKTKFVESQVTGLVSTASVSTTSSAMFAYTGTVQFGISVVNLDNVPIEIITAVGDFNKFIINPELADEVRGFLTDLGLDRARPGNRSPILFFNDAFAAYESRETAVQTLIPMRSSIEESIYILLNQRSNQQRVPSWADKIESICDQLAYNGTLPVAVEKLAHDLDSLLNLLAPAKQADIGREDLRDRIFKAVRFYHSLLETIDKSKLRVQPLK